MRAVIIAEAGVNHNGDMELAKKLIDVAALAGADYVKFQTFNVDLLVDENERERLRPYQLSVEDHRKLITHCKSAGIKFLSTPFDIASVDLLVNLGVDRIKIPSGEITNVPYLKHIGALGLPIILSTGMSALFEVEDALRMLELSGAEPQQITILHCTSEYPTPLASVNLRAMLTIRNRLNVAVGYSDHTQGIEIPIAAVAMGATIIEKHFTLSRAFEGPDHCASLEPGELRDMVVAIRSIEVALGSGIKHPTHTEIEKRGRIRNRFVL